MCADYVSVESVRVCRLRIRWSLFVFADYRSDGVLFVCADYVSDRVCSCLQTTYQIESVRVCRLRIRRSLFVCADFVPDAVCSCLQTTYQTGGEGGPRLQGDYVWISNILYLSTRSTPPAFGFVDISAQIACAKLFILLVFTCLSSALQSGKLEGPKKISKELVCFM